MKKQIMTLLSLIRNGLQYFEDGMISIHTPAFRKDESFRRAEKTSRSKTGFDGNIDWRLHTALWCGKMCSKLEGDFVECGVNTGYLMRAIADYTNFNELNKSMYLLDTFEGIPEGTLTEEERRVSKHLNPKDYKGSYPAIQKTFENIKHIKIIKGIIPNTLKEILTDKIAFISIDLNNAAPEIATIEFVWDKLVDGGMVLIDDYAYSPRYHVQRERWDEWANKNKVEILALATGQGLIIKRETEQQS